MKRASKDISLLLALVVPVIANGEVNNLMVKYENLDKVHMVMPSEDAILPEDIRFEDDMLSYKKSNENQPVGRLNILRLNRIKNVKRYIDSNDNFYKNPNTHNYPLGAIKKRGGLRR